ncbi:MAG TPA: hypothetical protein VGM23_15475 [Armatimonadota bacterium]
MKINRFLLLAACTLLPVALLAVPPISRQNPLPALPGGGQVITSSNAGSLQSLGRINVDVHTIIWKPDGREVAFLYFLQPVEVRNARNLQYLRTFGDGLRLTCFAYHPKTHLVAYCERRPGAFVQLFDTASGKSIQLNRANEDPDIAFSPDGQYLAIGGLQQLITLRNATTGKLLKVIKAGGAEGGLSLVFSPDSTLLAAGNRNDATTLFQVATGKKVLTLPKKMTQELRFSPDGKTLAVAYVDGNIGLWNVADGKLLHMVKSGNEVYTLDWSPKGNLLVTAGLNSKITLWDPKTMTVLKQLPSPEWVISARFSPDGTRLLTAGGTRNLSPGRKVQVWGIPQTVRKR